jgi:hypothetical protein
VGEAKLVLRDAVKISICKAEYLWKEIAGFEHG